MGTDLTELRVFQQAEGLAQAVWDLVLPWDRFAKDTIGKQLVRATDSVGANIAEAHGRFHFGDKLQFLYYARGSMYETRFWLRQAYRRNLLTDRSIQGLQDHLGSLPVAINNFIKALKQQRYQTRANTVKDAHVVYETPASISESPTLLLSTDKELFTEEEISWLTNLTKNES